MLYYIIKDKQLHQYKADKFSENCQETDIITAEELDKDPKQVVVVEDEDGNCTLALNPDYAEIELEKAKSAKIAENDKVRDTAINGGVTYKNILFDSDTDQKVNILAIVSAMSDTDTITWFGMDNDSLKCNKDDLLAIGALITTLHAFCWTHNAELKAAINAAESVDAVEAIEIDYTME